MVNVSKVWKHTFSPASEEKILSNIAPNSIKSNAPVEAVSINTNTRMNRLLDDKEGLGGQEHLQQAQASIAYRKRDKERVESERIRQKEAINQQLANREEARLAGEPDSNLSIFDNAIKEHTEKLRKINPQTSLHGTAWDVTKHSFKAMNAGSAGQIATKWGAVAGGYLAVNGAGRALTGGGATYNASGDRDIMGVPLV